MDGGSGNGGGVEPHISTRIRREVVDRKGSDRGADIADRGVVRRSGFEFDGIARSISSRIRPRSMVLRNLRFTNFLMSFPMTLPLILKLMFP